MRHFVGLLVVQVDVLQIVGGPHSGLPASGASCEPNAPVGW